MTQQNVSRRAFLKTSAAGAVAAGLVSAPAPLRGANLNSKMRVGFIGTGGRCGPHIGMVLAMQQAEGGEAYRGDWIAATQRVRLPEAPAEGEGMIVLVQEKYEEATAPIKQLGNRLKGEGFWALSGVIVVVAVLWYIVLRMLHQPRVVLRRSVAGPTAPTPPQDMTTLPAPRKAGTGAKG